MDIGFEFDMDWVWLTVSAITAVAGAIILSRRAAKDRKALLAVVPVAKPLPDIPTLTDAVHYIAPEALKPVTVEVMQPKVVSPAEVFADPLARWNSAPSQWAKLTFMQPSETMHVAAKNGMSIQDVTALYLAYNRILQLPGYYDPVTNAYAFRHIEQEGKVVEPDKDGAADRYIAQMFPSFVVKKIA